MIMWMALLRTNIELDPAELERAKKIAGLKTTKATVEFALARLDSTWGALTALERLAGRIRFKKGYSYKKSRG